MLEGWQSATGPDRLVPAVADAIATPKASTEAKLAGLRFISSVVEGGQAGKCLDAVVRAAAVGLQDKAVDPRDAGAGVIQQVLAVGARLSVQGCRLASTCHLQGRSNRQFWHMVGWLGRAASAMHLRRGMRDDDVLAACAWLSLHLGYPASLSVQDCAAVFCLCRALGCHAAVWNLLQHVDRSGGARHAPTHAWLGYLLLHAYSYSSTSLCPNKMC